MLARILVLVLLAAGALLACTHVHHHPAPQTARVEKHGPPPHAPAHGYRHKHETRAGNVDLVFDSDLGVYVVVDWPSCYFHDGHYYREAEGVWRVSTHLDAGWVVVSTGELPTGLAKKYGMKRSKKKRGPFPAKHGH